jgi:hypothetical protein
MNESRLRTHVEECQVSGSCQWSVVVSGRWVSVVSGCQWLIARHRFESLGGLAASLAVWLRLTVRALLGWAAPELQRVRRSLIHGAAVRKAKPYRKGCGKAADHRLQTDN